MWCVFNYEEGLPQNSRVADIWKSRTYVAIAEKSSRANPEAWAVKSVFAMTDPRPVVRNFSENNLNS